MPMERRQAAPKFLAITGICGEVCCTDGERAADRLCEASQRRSERGATPNSLQLQNDGAFAETSAGHTSFAGILGDPLSCCPSALVGTSLVLVDRDREPSASGPHEGIAHETLYPPEETFHFSFVLLQEVEKRLCPFARIVSHHSMHDTPPRADVLHVNAAGT